MNAKICLRVSAMLVGLLLALDSCSQAKADVVLLVEARSLTNFAMAYSPKPAEVIEAHSTVCLVTNVVETDYDPVLFNGSNQIFIWPSHGQTNPKIEKWVRSVVVERKTLSFEWEGKAQVVTVENGVSTNVVHLKLRQDWDVIP